MAEADYPIVITDLTERGWEGAEAAGDRRDAAPGAPAFTPLASATSLSGIKFQVALSFAGEQRSYVQCGRRVNGLGDSTLLRRQQQIALWGTNQVETLQRVYLEDGTGLRNRH